MTTIAWDGKTLAADNCLTDNGHRVRFTGKLRRLKDGRLAAIAGGAAAGLALLDWLDSATDDPPAIHGRADALVIGLDRKVWVYDKRGFPLEIAESLYAMGSGGELALGAMMAGASAAKAVAIAVERDGGSGFGVSTLTLKGRG